MGLFWSAARRIQPLRGYFMQMIPQTLEHGIPLPLGDFALHLGERKMDDVVMVEIFAGQFGAEFQPHFVEQINFLGSQPRRMRPQIEDLLLAR